jgi:hypothetical protein
MSAKGMTTPCKVVAVPAPFSNDEYAEAAAEIDERLASLPGIVAVYRIGGISAPGISDIDRVAVLEAPAQIDTLWAGLAERTRAIAMHGPFAVDRETFERHRWFAHLEPLEVVAGVPVGTQEPPHPRYLSTLLGVEGMVIALLKLLKQLSIGRVKARAFMCEIHALGHSLRLAMLSSETAPAAHRLIEDIDELRRGWFREQPENRVAAIRAIVARGGPALLEALDRLAPPDEGGDERPASLAMSSPWRNVTVAAADGHVEPGAAFRIPQTARLTSGSRRLGELRWRSRRRRLMIPAPGLEWLQQPTTPEIASLRTERDRVVRRYSDFVDACGSGWSSIGFARPFLSR